MSVNDETVRLNKSFEGYHKKLDNGDCTAYQTYLGGGKYDIPTIGYGTTKGVKMGMVMTEAEATSRMMDDLKEAEGYVQQYVTVPINENEKGALTLFCNNCGPANLKKLIVPLNKGDRMGTANKFPLYVKAQGRTLAGLVSRRAREQALFLKPVEATEEPAMPQTVSKAPEPPSRKSVAAAVIAAGAGVQQLIPADPLGTAEGFLSTGTRIRGVAQQSHDLGGWAVGLPGWPYILGACALGGGLYWAVCHWLPSKQETS
ncbi:lysozyme [Hyphomicrobium sp. MC1]|uniref:lysozyme n=1 Tax=Hyphomicrobium sp. (strain MC1) TaxID=717785 RepID=UPI000213DCD9|nr:lysozyme [Hyphomicrobium sp. MC1]CCB64482.1 Lysozyme (modular protein) [Hyphomicrobium sp. MC1]